MKDIEMQGIGELREIKAEINLLSRSDGSVMYSQGRTTVLASVNGPVEVKLQNLSAEKASVEVYFRPKNGLPSVNDRFIENFVQHSCLAGLLAGLHPRTAYRIQIQEMEDNGGLLACCINATILAIINSGLDIQYPLAAVYCVIDEAGEILLDPPAKDVRGRNVNTITFVFDGAKKDAVAVHNVGKFTPEEYKRCMQLCRAASDDVFSVYKKIVDKFSTII